MLLQVSIRSITICSTTKEVKVEDEVEVEVKRLHDFREMKNGL